MARVSLVDIIYQPGLDTLRKALAGTNLNSVQITNLLRRLDSGNILFVAFSIAANSSPNNVEQAAKNLIPILITAFQYAQFVDQFEPNIVTAATENLSRYVDTNGPVTMYRSFSQEYPPEQTSRRENYETTDGKSNPLFDEIKKQLKNKGQEKLKDIWEKFKKSPTGQEVEKPPTPTPTNTTPAPAPVLQTTGTVTITTGEDAFLAAGAATRVIGEAPHLVTNPSALAIRLQPPLPTGNLPPPTTAVSGKIVGFSVDAQTPLSGVISQDYLSFGLLKEIPATEAVKTFGLNSVTEGTKFFGITEKGAMMATKVPQIGATFTGYIPESAGISTLVATPTSTIAVSGVSTFEGISVGTATTVGTTGLTTVGTSGLTAVGTTAATTVGTTAATTVGTTAATTVATTTATTVGTTAVTTAATTVGTAALTTAGTTAVATTAGAAGGAAAGAAAGAPTGPGAIITAIIGALIGVILGLIPTIYKMTKDYLEAITAGALVLVFSSFAGIGLVPSLLLGGVTTGVFSVTGASPVSAISNLSTSLVGLAATATSKVAVSFGVAFVAIPIVIAFTIYIINTSGFVVPPAPISGGIYDPGVGFLDPTSCPLIGGRVSYPSYNPTQEDDPLLGGHGSQAYWRTIGCYHSPQESGCNSSTLACNSSWLCNQCADPQCPWYGFSADIAGGPGGTPVVLPLVNGQPANWNCHHAFNNGIYGVTVDCDTTDGYVHLVLTHVDLNSNSEGSNMPSGTVVANLFDQGGNTHLHLEVQISGLDWVRPELYFCGSQ